MIQDQSLQSPDTAMVDVDYSNEDGLVDVLNDIKIEVLICTFSLHNQDTSDSQVNLVRAADKSTSVKRFIPSEFNVDYDLGDDYLYYEDKRFHRQTRRALEASSTLEFTYVYTGMLMDYFAYPDADPNVRELGIFIDPIHRKALLPGDGNAKMSMTLSTDVAHYLALALDMESWPRVLSTVASTLILNDLVQVVERAIEAKVQISYQPIEAYKSRANALLPRNQDLADRFPQRFPHGTEQVRELIGDLEASVGLGAFDLEHTKDGINLVDFFGQDSKHPIRFEYLARSTWKCWHKLSKDS